jgi:hypothetical protein
MTEEFENAKKWVEENEICRFVFFSIFKRKELYVNPKFI